ncbi:unnamed protein product [Orchesella dallaii]|uniref:G-protein coupled receptors family 1 profile domain-containing protein n=1 Tax=Orchesella dallaii TaxID=48710 RepID=A0ABP1PSU7_9HEXA
MEHVQVHQNTCVFTDIPINETWCTKNPSPNDTHKSNDSQNLSYSSYHQVCYSCHFVAINLFDKEGPEENVYSTGFLVVYVLGGFSIFIGACGLLTNILNVIVLRTRPCCGPSLTALLIPLAFCDFLTNLGISCSIGAGLMMHGKISRGFEVQAVNYYLGSVAFLAQEASVCITLLISVERYFVVLKPLHAKRMFSVRKTKLFCAIVVGIVLLLHAPRWFETRWRKIEPAERIPPLEGFPYILEFTPFGHFYYEKIGHVYFILNYMFPIVILFIVNLLLYRGIKASSKERRRLSISSITNSDTSCPLQNEVTAALMFRWVVIVLILCQVVPILVGLIITLKRVAYREFGYFNVICLNVNAAVNIIIYCAFGKSFRSAYFSVLKGMWWRNSQKYPMSTFSRRTSTVQT